MKTYIKTVKLRRKVWGDNVIKCKTEREGGDGKHGITCKTVKGGNGFTCKTERGGVKMVFL